MYLFIKLEEKTYTFEYNEGDNLDCYILLAFQKYFNNKNQNMYKLIATGYPNFLYSSCFSLVGKPIKFGNKTKLEAYHDNSVVNHYYSASQMGRFTQDNIKYINTLMPQ